MEETIDKRVGRKLNSDSWLEYGITFLRLSIVYQEGARWARPWAALSLTFTTSGIIALVASMYIYLNEIEKVAHMAHHAIIMADVALAVVHYNMPHNKINLRRLITGMKSTFAYGDWVSQEEIDSLQNERSKDNKRAVKYLWFTVVYTMIILLNFAIIDKHTSNHVLLLFPCWMPFTLDSPPIIYWLFLSWQCITLIASLFGIYGVVAHFYLMHAYIYTELKILLVALSHLRELKPGLIPIQAVKQCAIHHQQIIDNFKASQSVLGFINILILISGVLVMAITGIALVSDNLNLKLQFGGIMLIQLIFLFIVCRYSQNIMDLSSEVGEACYGTEWMLMDKPSIMCLEIMIERSFRPLVFRSLIGHELSLDMYMSMVKTAYSWFNMIYANND